MKKVLVSLLIGMTVLSISCNKEVKAPAEDKVVKDVVVEDINEIREEGIEYIDLFLKANLSDCYKDYYADETGITLKFEDDGILELLKADKDLYDSFIKLNMNIYEKTAKILKADENYHVCVTYTDKHEENNRVFTNTFFVIVDGEIVVNYVED